MKEKINRSYVDSEKNIENKPRSLECCINIKVEEKKNHKVLRKRRRNKIENRAGALKCCAFNSN